MNDFKSYDEWEAASEYLRDEENATSEDLRQAFDVEELTIVEHFAAENGLIDSEQALSDLFDQDIMPMLLEQNSTPGKAFDDQDMINQAFNDWTDGLCKDDQIHDLQYNQYCYIGEWSDDR